MADNVCGKQDDPQKGREIKHLRQSDNKNLRFNTLLVLYMHTAIHLFVYLPIPSMIDSTIFS